MTATVPSVGQSARYPGQIEPSLRKRPEVRIAARPSQPIVLRFEGASLPVDLIARIAPIESSQTRVLVSKNANCWFVDVDKTVQVKDEIVMATSTEVIVWDRDHFARLAAATATTMRIGQTM